MKQSNRQKFEFSFFISVEQRRSAQRTSLKTQAIAGMGEF
jgi:hypothetical protein